MFGVPTASSPRPSVDGRPKKLEPGLADHLPGLRFPLAGCEPWRGPSTVGYFEHVWQEARNGEELLTNIEHLAADRAAFVMALLQLLLLHRSRNRTDSQRQIDRGRVP